MADAHPTTETDLAFPCSMPTGIKDGHPLGLTKRELIAAMTLQGLVSNPHLMAAGKTHDGTPLNETRFAEQAVYMADALLKELAK